MLSLSILLLDINNSNSDICGIIERNDISLRRIMSFSFLFCVSGDEFNESR